MTVTDYVIESTSDNGTTWTVVPHATSPTTSMALTGMTRGTVYKFRVSAVNGKGIGAASALATATTLTLAPQAPTGLAVVTEASTATSVQVSWTAPVDNGGSAITDYKIEYSTNGTNWSTLTRTASATTSATLAGLSPGTTYQVRVSAKNAIGVSAGHATGAVTTLAMAPASLSVSNITSTSLRLTWTAPLSNGGAPIRGYKVEISSNGGTTWTAIDRPESTSLSYTVAGLTRATEYQFRVSAVNSGGTGIESNVVGETTQATVPTVPTALATSSPTTSSVTVSWNAPFDDGGSPITDYKLELSRDSGQSWSVVADQASVVRYSATSLRLTALPGRARTYQFRVSAVNSIGTGLASSAVSAATVPTAPPYNPGLTVSPSGAGGLNVVWTTPSDDGGSPIIDYKIEFSSDGGASWSEFAHTASIANSMIITGLMPVTSYLVRVSAVNLVGVGGSRQGTGITNPDVPGVPSNFAVYSVGSTYVSVKFSSPVNRGEPNVSGYRVEASSDGGTSWAPVDFIFVSNAGDADRDTRGVISGLNPMTEYQFRVAAYNYVGHGHASEGFPSTTLAGVPAAPTTLHLSPVTSSSVLVSWSPPSDRGSAITDFKVEAFYEENGIRYGGEFAHTASTANSIVVTGLSETQRYSFRVSAINAIGVGPASSMVYEGDAPDYMPSNLVLTATSATTFAVSWSPAVRSLGSDFLVEVSDSSDFYRGDVYRTSSTTYDVTAFSSEKTFYVRVRYRLSQNLVLTDVITLPTPRTPHGMTTP
jgi:titin